MENKIGDNILIKNIMKAIGPAIQNKYNHITKEHIRQTKNDILTVPFKSAESAKLTFRR